MDEKETEHLINISPPEQYDVFIIPILEEENKQESK
jgi:hypothetical protein